MLHALTAASPDLDFELKAINPSPQEKIPFFIRVPLELDIEASYRSMAEYLDRITRKTKLLDIRRIEITGNNETYPRLKVKLHVDAYFVEHGGTAR